MKFEPNITFLRYFFTAAQNKSISKAAQETFVSQSAISQAIGKLESTLRKQLITHEKNRFQLTPDGVLLFEKCKQIFGLFSEIEDAFNESDDLFRGKFPFACTHSFALSLLPRFLRELSQTWPGVEPILRLGHTDVIVDLIKRGEVEFGIVLDNEDFSAFHITEIYQGEYRLYQAKNMIDVSLNKFIMSEERREVSVLKQHLVDNKIQIHSCMEVSSWEVIASLTEQGLGIGFLPDYMVGKRSITPYKHPTPSIPYRILAISSKNRNLSRNAKMFIDMIRNE